MKISYNIVLAAFLGTMSVSEVVQAVERHHLHNYVQFIPDVHPEGVTLYKDFGLSTNGYPYQSFATADPAPNSAASPVKVSDMSKETTDTDIKLKPVIVEVPVPKSLEEQSKDQEVDENNKATAEKLEKETKAAAEANPATAKPAFDALKQLKLK